MSAENTPYSQPEERVTPETLRREVEYLGQNALVDGLMQAVGGLIAVLNSSRQVLALNETFLRSLGIDDVGGMLGLRLGEVFACAHVANGLDGCGTTPFCPSCGLALATVVALADNSASERTCALHVQRGQLRQDFYLSVRASPITLDGHRLVLVFLQDITDQQKWASLEKVFFHDINNIINPLLGASELLLDEVPNPPGKELAEDLHQLTARLAQEIRLQQGLMRGEDLPYRVNPTVFAVGDLFDEVGKTLPRHGAFVQRFLHIDPPSAEMYLNTDRPLLLRILTNMLLNAAEASAEGEAVRLWAQFEGAMILFQVWNSAVIPQDSRQRIFQRNFSTKGSWGRGLGTYSVKLFGEQFLGGKVDFSSQEGHGTVFWIQLQRWVQT